VITGVSTRAPHEALNAVLVVLRMLAHDPDALPQVARALDFAEFLPLLIADQKDRSQDFRSLLVELCNCHEHFGLALARLDGESFSLGSQRSAELERLLAAERHSQDGPEHRQD